MGQLRFYPYTNPSRAHPIPIQVRITIGDVVGRGPVVYAEIEENSLVDLSIGDPYVEWRVYSDIENLSVPIGTFEGEVNQVVTPQDFTDQGIILQDGNIISLYIEQGDESGELNPPIDDETGDPKDPVLTGETQNYMFIFSAEDMETLSTQDMTSPQFIVSTFNLAVQNLSAELDETPQSNLEGDSYE